LTFFLARARYARYLLDLRATLDVEA